jgi:hypothetical protein
VAEVLGGHGAGGEAGGAAAADLLGLGDPLSAAPPAVSRGGPHTPIAKVPNLGPPRSHEGKVK